MIDDILVSVLMTSYNSQNYIAQAIESVLESTYKCFELIIVDDCSKDDTIAIAKFYADRDIRVNVYCNDVNLGDYKNRNKAASYAKGKYIKYLDSDDIIMPWGLGVLVYGMERFADAGLGISTNINENIIFPNLLSSAAAYRSYYYKNLVLSVGPSAAIIRRDLFEKLGGFSGQNYFGDTELWLRIASFSAVVILPTGLVFWREHDGQQSAMEQKNEMIELRRYELNYSILTDDTSPLDRVESGIILQNLKNIKTRKAIVRFLVGDFKKAITIFIQYKIGLVDFVCAMKKNKVR
jgi:glycosyltransferase involved in cell wall biosynthesis